MNSLSGAAAVQLRLIGNSGSDRLSGSSRADIMDGRIGADIMTGLGGDDIYSVDDVGDRVVEVSGGGVDTVESTITYRLAAGLENLTLLGTGAINGSGNDAANILRGNAGANVLAGFLGDDIYYIGAGDRVAEAANGGRDTVVTTVSYTAAAEIENVTLAAANITATGNALANILRGFLEGPGVLKGLGGNDVYYVDGNDSVVEAANAGVDTVYYTAESGTYTLGANVENLVLLAPEGPVNGNGNALDNRITGGAASNRIDGRGGADTMIGGDGDDTYVTDGGDTIIETGHAASGTDTVISSVNTALGANLENLTLIGPATYGAGNTLANTLTGNSLVNRLVGGAGNDVYNVQNAADEVVEGANAGTDTVNSSVGYRLSANVENLTLTGVANINAKGNALSNAITGNTGANRIEGGAGNDALAGAGGADIFVFHAGSGADSIIAFSAVEGAEHDRIQFDKSQYADFAAVMAHVFEPSGPGLPAILIVDGSDSIFLNVQKSMLSPDDFLFV